MNLSHRTQGTPTPPSSSRKAFQLKRVHEPSHAVASRNFSFFSLSFSNFRFSLTSVTSLPDPLEGAGGNHKLPRPFLSNFLHTFIFMSDHGWQWRHPEAAWGEP